jgi:hypothetical protein
MTAKVTNREFPMSVVRGPWRDLPEHPFEAWKEVREIEKSQPDICTQAAIDVAYRFGTSGEDIDEMLEIYGGVLPFSTFEDMFLDVPEERFQAECAQAMARRLESANAQERAEYLAWAARMKAAANRAKKAMERAR